MSGTSTQNGCFRGGTCKFTWNGSEIPYIGVWWIPMEETWLKDLDAQVESLLSMKCWLAKGSKQAPHVGGSTTI